MATVAELTARRDEIDRLLAKGVRSTSVNGISVTRDLAMLHDERRRIDEQLDRGRRPRVSSIDLSRF